MLEWASPLWFLALPAALLPLAGVLRPWSLRFSALGAMRESWSVRRGLAWLPAVLQVGVLVLVIIALARPQKVERETERESEGVDILLAIDTSGSMDSDDMGVAGTQLTRLEAGKRVMSRFIEERKNDRIGLVVFGEEAFTQVPLTLDHDGLQDFVGQLQKGVAGANKTAVGDAIAIGCKRLKELDAPSKVMILVTDGQSNAGQIDPLQAAQAAAALGVKVYTIGVGSTGGGGGFFGFGRRGADVDEASLTKIAELTHAEYFRATDAKALAAVYAKIDKLEPSPAKVKEYVHREELFENALLPALALWLVELLLSVGPLRRTP